VPVAVSRECGLRGVAAEGRARCLAVRRAWVEGALVEVVGCGRDVGINCVDEC
jgi:hypothetical protein